jgi:hypothetical protein
MEMKETTRDSRPCPNCGFSFDASNHFCPNCGQKSALPGLSLVSVIKEYVDIVFNFEYRVWISIFHLFIPGKLSTQFFEGKRQKYLSPLRIFLIFGLLHFTLFGNLLNNKFDKPLTKFEKYIQEQAFTEQLGRNIDSLPDYFFISEGLNPVQTKEVKEKLRLRLTRNDMPPDSLFFNVDSKSPKFIETEWRDSFPADSLIGSFWILVLENIGGKWTFKSIPLRFSDIYTIDADDIIKKENISTDFGKWQVRQELKLPKEIKNFTLFVTGQLIWMVIGSMLLISLFQRILYFRLPFHYAHHLIYQLHFHAFSFLVISIFMLGMKSTRILESFDWFILIIVVYQLLAIKKIFQQGWFITIGKVFVTNVIYLFISFTILIAMLVISMLRF